MAIDREQLCRLLHRHFRPKPLLVADWDSGAILGKDNAWRSKVSDCVDDLLLIDDQPEEPHPHWHTMSEAEKDEAIRKAV